jgi:hypothetical protein
MPAKNAGMHPLLADVASWAGRLGLLALNFCFWAWIWEASAGPAAGTHIPAGK